MRADSIKMKKLPIAPCIEQMYPKEVLLRVDYGQAVEIVCEAATQRMRFLGRNSSMRDGEFHSRQEELKEAIGLINACKITPAVEPCSGSRGQAARIE